MNLGTLVAAGLRQRPLIQLLNLLGLSLGVALVVALVLSAGQLRDAAGAEARGIDLVVGASGSPLQLVLSTVYHADAPTGNIPAGQWPRWRAHPLVEMAVPIAMGDFVSGYRLVGTTRDIQPFFGLELAEGNWWEETGTVVVGARAARELGLGVGDDVLASHGSQDPDAAAHHDHPLRVRGILAPTGRVIDRLVLTDLRTYWQLHGTGQGGRGAAPVGEDGHDPDHGHDHGDAHDHADDHDHGHDPGDSADGHPAHEPHADPHHDAQPLPGAYSAAELEGEEVTSLLIRFSSPLATGRLSREISAQPRLQAASPAQEMARLLAVFGVLLLAAQGLAVLVLAVSAVGLFVALYQALEQRRYDIALLRALGARRGRVGLLLLGEALTVATGAALVGLVLGHAGVEAVGQWAGGASPLPITGLAWEPRVLWVLPLGWSVALLAAALPAWRAYRMEVPDVLARRG